MINLRVVSTGLLYQIFKVGDPLTPRKWGALLLLMTGKIFIFLFNKRT